MSNETPKRNIPKPGVYVDTQPFWDGLKQGKLMLQFCTETQRFQYYPRPVSIYTGRRSLEWREVSGKGSIYATTTVRISGPGLEGRLPLSVVTVELDEGVRMIANLLDAEADQVKIGARVKLAWDSLAEGQPYPAFALA